MRSIVLFVGLLAITWGVYGFDEAEYRQRIREELAVLNQSVFPALAESRRCDVFEVSQDGAQVLWTGSDALRVNHVGIIDAPGRITELSKLFSSSLRPEEMAPLCHVPEIILIFSGSGRSVWIGVSRECQNLRFKFTRGGEPQDISMPFEKDADAFSELVKKLNRSSSAAPEPKTPGQDIGKTPPSPPPPR